MEFLNDPGFFGTSATMWQDLTMVVELLFFAVLCVGVAVQLKGYYKWHDRLQIPVVLLNLLFIGLVMLPAFGSISGELPNQLHQIPVAVPFIHGILGTVAQGLAIYCLLAGLKILPRKIGVLRYWMWAAFLAWGATVLFGVTTYLVWYTPLQGPTAPPTAEHDAVVLENVSPVTATTVVSSTQTVVVTAQVDEHAAETSPATATIEVSPSPTTEILELVDEHAVEAELTEEVIDEMAEMIDEHMAELPPMVEVEYAGEMGQAAWTALEPSNSGPGPRQEQALFYHGPTEQLYLFGGRDSNQVHNDVWALDVPTLTWRELAADSTAQPTPRYSLIMMVDEAGENLYIAAGHTAERRNLGDLWRLDLQTEQWTEIPTETGPTARYGNPGVRINDNLVLTHGFGETRYDDTWQFNTATQQWENITPAGELPLERCLFATAAVEEQLVLHGGCATPVGPCFLDDTWVLDPAEGWRQITAEVKPLGRQFHSLVATSPEHVLLFGGQDANRAPRNDLWQLNLSSGEWLKFEVLTEAVPQPRYNHGAVWLPNTEAMLLYGGRSEAGVMGDLWQLEIE